MKKIQGLQSPHGAISDKVNEDDKFSMPKDAKRHNFLGCILLNQLLILLILFLIIFKN